MGSNVENEPKPLPPKTGLDPPKIGDDPNTGLAPNAGACPKAWPLSMGDVLGAADLLKTLPPVGEAPVAAGDAKLFITPPNGEAGAVLVAPPNTPPGFGALVSNIDPDVPNPALPPKIPLGEDSAVDGAKMEFMLPLLLPPLPPPNIDVFEDVAGILENTDPGVLPNGDDAGLIIGFAKTFAVDGGVC